MLTVSKECRFDAAHILTDHAGQCKNLHGHTYRLIVKVADRKADCGCSEGGSAIRNCIDSDMVIDFKDLKQVMRAVIIERFDHAFIYNRHSEAEREIAAVIAKYGMKSVALPFRSTAENLARYFFLELREHLAVVAVKLYETPDSCAEFHES